MTGLARPRLQPGVRLVEQTYRGERSTLARTADGASYFRFGPVEARVVRAFDGHRTPAEIAESLGAEGMRVGAGAVEAFARRLAALGVVERSLAERSAAQLERLLAERTRRRAAGDVLRVRRSLGDPDAFLGRTLPALRWCFTRGFVIASCALFALYVAILLGRWDAFGAQVAASYLPSTIGVGDAALLWGVTVVVTIVHELGHAYACKAHGGEVRELGVMLLYFRPAMYCNVSDAWGFQDRAARLWVTAAGSWAELVVASVAAVVWWAAAPETAASHVALATMLIGGVAAVATNANPLIPLDGYYALVDCLELPNLRHRAGAHVRWWLECHALGVDLPEPAATPRERRILLAYGALSIAYGAALVAVMAFLLLRFAGDRLGTLGVALALGWVSAVLRRPASALLARRALVARRLRAALRGRWRRGGAWLGAAAAAIVAGLGAPWPVTVVGTFEAAPVRRQVASAPAAGVVAEVLVREGERVAAGAPLLRVVDYAATEALGTAVRAAAARGDSEATARALGAGDVSRLAAGRRAADARLRALREQGEGALVRARRDGVALTTRPEALLGRRVAGGAPLLRLGEPDSLELRIALGPGAARVRVGHRVRLFSDAAPADARHTTLQTVSPAAGVASVEARARTPAGDAWRPGVRGEARVEVARSTVGGALWWRLRTWLRTDLLL